MTDAAGFVSLAFGLDATLYCALGAAESDTQAELKRAYRKSAL